jgi:hypothetical protein
MNVKDEFMFEPYAAWTAIGVSELISEVALVEIRAIARRGWRFVRVPASPQSGRQPGAMAKRGHQLWRP